MSEMEFFHGYFRESDKQIEPEDTDDFYDLQEEYGVYFVKVNGKLYEFWSSGVDTDLYGFNVVVPPNDLPQLMCYWYNGGAGIREVVESTIEEWVKNNE